MESYEQNKPVINSMTKCYSNDRGNNVMIGNLRTDGEGIEIFF
jgi:hypothetical protein